MIEHYGARAFEISLPLVDLEFTHLEATLNILTKWAPALIDITFKDIDWDTAALYLSG